MKFLICGFGNVAQRHYRNLRKLLPKSTINVYTHKYDKHRIFDNDLNLTYTNNLLTIYDIDNLFYNIDDALNACKYDAVIICTLPPDRIDIAIESAKKGFDLFIEKPLDSNINNSVDKINLLVELVKNKNIKVIIGYQMRFHPVIQDIKKCIINDEIGEIHRIEISHGNNIKNWSKGRELSDFYAMNKYNGGGVILSQIHEIDYLNYIFEDNFYPMSAVSSKNDNKIDTNVIVIGDIMINYDDRDIFVPVVMTLDFINSVPYRKIRIFGKKDMVIGDLTYNNVLSSDAMKHYNVEWNDLFLNELQCFIKFIKIKKIKKYDMGKLSTLNDGITSLEIACNIKDML